LNLLSSVSSVVERSRRSFPTIERRFAIGEPRTLSVVRGVRLQPDSSFVIANLVRMYSAALSGV